MKRSTNIIFILFSIFILNNSIIKASEVGEAFYVADVTEGYIGIFKDKPIDSPTDNIFTIILDKQPDINDEIWLSYELFGISNHTGISRSINDQLSIGGHLIGTNQKWQQQEECINPEWLKEGKNVIRFSQPAKAYNYKVKNLGLRIKKSNDAERKIIVNQPEIHEHAGKWGYSKGFIKGCGSSSVQLYANDELVETFDSEFEVLSHNNNDSENWTVSLKAIFADGELIEETVDFTTKTTLKRSAGIPVPAASQIVMPYIYGQAFVAHLDEVAINIEPNALQENTDISITALRQIDLPPLDASMVNVTKNEEGYRFLPHGTQFDEAAQIKLAFDENKIPKGYTTKDIKTYYFDETAKHWIALPLDSVNVTLNTVISNTTHFTDMINGIIKVPESPETGAFTPTSIKDVKAADPSANINTIEPPSANNMGTANVGYPIVIPPGRQGMQPQLGIQYSSGGGNDWLGLGWNLSLPKITIETRWGVPRYGDIDGDGSDDNLETETYLLNGEQLAPTAHRSLQFEQRQANKQFYPRVEGSFQKIIRHGNSPNNYWWEVTDKSGTVYSYGGVKNGGIEENAILRVENGGPIASWALVETRDLYNNFVRYHYTNQMDFGVDDCTIGTCDEGFNCYIDRITYTGHGTTEGKYEVRFERDREIDNNWQANRRQDVNIDCRYGLKKVTADLLKRIEVIYRQKGVEQNIRSYELNYVSGAFHKTLLEKITEFDSAGNQFTEHEFVYHDDVNSEEGYFPLGNTETWSTGDDDLESGLVIDFLNDKLDNASPLGTSKSDGSGIGGTGTAGIGPGQTKILSGGLTGAYDPSFNEGLLALVDIDGDGLPDKVFKDSELLWYKKNLTLPGETSKYSDKVYKITGVYDFSKGTSRTTSGGGEVHFGIQGGIQKNTTTGETYTYFSDANGDQLIDIINNGVVYFNESFIKQENGIIEGRKFTISSAKTQCEVCEVGKIDVANFEPVTISDNLLNPLHDVVKVWIAPYNGIITIDAPVNLTVPANPSNTADGVRVSIQQNSNSILWQEDIPAENFNQFNTDIITQNVEKGDRIYFRVHSISDGTNDEVAWSPTITYSESCNCNYEMLDYTIFLQQDGTFDLHLEIAYNNTASKTFFVQINGETYGPFTDQEGTGFEIVEINGIPYEGADNVIIYNDQDNNCSTFFDLNISNCANIQSASQDNEMTCGGSEVKFTVKLDHPSADNQSVNITDEDGISIALKSIGEGVYQGMVTMKNTASCDPEFHTFTASTYCNNTFNRNSRVMQDDFTIEVKVYPNPAHLEGFFTIDYSNDGCTASLSPIPECVSYFSPPTAGEDWVVILDTPQTVTSIFQYTINYPTELITLGCYNALESISFEQTCNPFDPSICANVAGLMQTSQTYVCEYDQISMDVAFAFADPNSVTGYLLHEGEFFNLATSTIIDYDLNASFDSPGSSYNNTPLYISAITGYPDADGFPQLNHPCTVWTPYGAYTIFLDPIGITILDEECQSGGYYITISVDGGVGNLFPNSAYLTVSDGTTNYNNFSAGEPITFGPYSYGEDYLIEVLDAKGCTGSIGGIADCTEASLAFRANNNTNCNIDATIKDANNLPIYRFNAEEDFLLSAPVKLAMPLKGKINIEGMFTKNITTDDIEVKIEIKNDENEEYCNEVYLQNFLVGATNQQIDFTDIDINEGDLITFQLSAESTVDWQQVNWQPKVYYVSLDDDYGFHPSFNLSVLEFQPTVHHEIFNNVLQAPVKWVAPQTGAIYINPVIDLPSNIPFVFTVKTLLNKVDYNSANPINVVANKEYFFEFHVETEILGVDYAYVEIEQGNTSFTHEAGVYSKTNNYLFSLTDPDEENQNIDDGKIFGNIYRNWGQFVYNPEGDTNAAIDEQLLFDLYNTTINEQNFGVDLEGLCDGNDDAFSEECLNEVTNAIDNYTNQFAWIGKFMPVFPNIEETTHNTEEALYSGWSTNTYIKKDKMRSSRFGSESNFINPFPGNQTQNISSDGKGALASNRISKTYNKSYNVGVSAVGFSFSDGTTTQLYDYFDLNGDRFPDIINKDADPEKERIQYTLPIGGYENKSRQIMVGNAEDDISLSNHRLDLGRSLGGGIPLSGDKNSDNTSGGSVASGEELAARVSVGLSGGLSNNSDNVAFDNMDINGDGLPDRVYKDGFVQLNFGYRYGQRENWNYTSIVTGSSSSHNLGGNLGFESGGDSFSFGVGAPFSMHSVKSRLIDVNGDGLLDMLSDDEPDEELPPYVQCLVENNGPCCENENGGFEQLTANLEDNNNCDQNFINQYMPNWYSSHGSPTIVEGHNSERAIAMWHGNHSKHKSGLGEGVFTEYNFEANYIYTISFDYSFRATAKTSPNSQLIVELATGLEPRDIIDDKNDPCYWGGIGTAPNIVHGYSTQEAKTQTEIFNVNLNNSNIEMDEWYHVKELPLTNFNVKSFDQIRFRAFLNSEDTTANESKVNIDNICINKIDPNVAIINNQPSNQLNENRSTAVNTNNQVNSAQPPQDLKVRLNTGNGFSKETITWTGAYEISNSNSVGESSNGAGTVCFTPGLWKLCVNISGNGSAGISREKLQIRDVDGDGFPDYVYTDPDEESDDEFFVKRSTIGKTNLLKNVIRPLGANFTIDYKRIGNTYEMPNDVWALSSVIIDDGFSADGADHTDATNIKGADQMLNTFEYENGYYHRCEREFYGFKKVKTQQRNVLKIDKPIYEVQAESVPVYRIVEQTFINHTTSQFKLNQVYFAKGLMTNEVLMDDKGFIYKETNNYYGLRERMKDISYFPVLSSTQNIFYEKSNTRQTAPSKSTSSTFNYDMDGNIIYFEDYGEGANDDDYYTTITYHDDDDLLSKNITGVPKSIVVTDNSNQTLRKRETEVYPTGKISKIKQYFELQADPAESDMVYDAYGNIEKMTRPKNANEDAEEDERRQFYIYKYDSEVQTYPTDILDAYGYSSSSMYDLRFGQLTSTIDLNGNEMKYTLDDVGRIETIIGPLELEKGIDYTIKFEYNPNAEVPYAKTFHYDPANEGNDLITVTLIDGLKRPVQVKKDIEFTLVGFNGIPIQSEKMSVSGRIIYDAFGRTIAGYHPVSENIGNNTSFSNIVDKVKPTQTDYDILDRPTKITLPDETYTKNVYSIGSNQESGNSFITEITDGNGHWKRSYTNLRNLTVATQEELTEKESIWTRFYYNAINELKVVKDHDGNETSYDYDMLGRKLSMDHPDGGLTTFEYDRANNLTKKITANLRAIDADMAIVYKYDRERLTNITYPQNKQNNVAYSYGPAGANENGAGKIVEQFDASGSQTFGYNKLGALVKNNRTVILDDPDNLGGIEAANNCMDINIETNWEYDTWNRIKTLTYPDGEVVNYQYNTGGLLNKMTGTLNGATYEYIKNLGYDEFEQRVHLNYGNATTTNYTYEPERRRLKTLTASKARSFPFAQQNFIKNSYTYDNENNIKKIENNATGQSIGGNTNYSFIYDKMNRLTHAEGSHNDEALDVYELDMTYGNTHTIETKQQTHTKDGTIQKNTDYDLEYVYENDDHPHALSSVTKNNDKVTTYTYDANGNMYDTKTELDCGPPSLRKFRWDEENRLHSVTDNGAVFRYVYDAAGERIIKNTGQSNSLWINGRKPQVGTNGPVGTFNSSNGDVTCLERFTVYVNPYVVVRNGEVTKHYYIESQRIASKLTGTMEADSKIETYEETPVYYFHPDHLGNSSYITDLNGEITQHLEYFPFGEVFIEQNGSYNTPYKYNGKELDSETGLYYYGARYYNPELSLWLSVDPLADHPNVLGWSSYHFSYNSPLSNTDPDGKLPVPLVTGAIGGAIGGIVGGAIGFFTTKGSLKQKLKGAGKGLVGGAVGGFIVGSGAGLIAGAGLTTGGAIIATGVVGGASGAASSTAVQGLEWGLGERDGISGEDVAIEALIGIPANLFSAGAGHAAKKIVDGAVKSKINNPALRALKKGIRKGLKKNPNISTKEARKTASVTAKEIMKDRTASLSKVKVAIQSGTATVIQTTKQLGTKGVKEKVR